jgi:hypothetical protein
LEKRLKAVWAIKPTTTYEGNFEEKNKGSKTQLSGANREFSCAHPASPDRGSTGCACRDGQRHGLWGDGPSREFRNRSPAPDNLRFRVVARRLWISGISIPTIMSKNGDTTSAQMISYAFLAINSVGYNVTSPARET